MSRIRILTIGHSYTVAVNRAIVREVARDPQFDVTVAAPAAFRGDLRYVTLDDEPDVSRLKVVGIDVSRDRWLHIMKYDFRRLQELIVDGQFDVVHAWEEPYIYAGYQISRALRESPAHFCFRTAQSKNKWYPPPFRQFERSTVSRAQGWIAGGNLVYEAMVKRGYPRGQGRVITLAVDTGMFRPLRDEERHCVLDELSLEGPVIGYLGRLTEAKGMDVLMAAMEQVKSPKWSLLMLGSGPYQSRIERWAKQRGWLDRVRVKLARHEEVSRYLGAVDMLVAPSQTRRNWKEQFGRMIIEAFACGIPVIGSDSGEIPYVIGDSGVVIPESDSSAWARAIDELLQHPQEAARLGKSGLRRVANYSVSSVAERYRDYYRVLANRRSKAA